MKEMTDYDKERLYTLRKERDNATKHLCPRVAAARQREIDKLIKKYKDGEKDISNTEMYNN